MRPADHTATSVGDIKARVARGGHGYELAARAQPTIWAVDLASRRPAHRAHSAPGRQFPEQLLQKRRGAAWRQ